MIPIEAAYPGRCSLCSGRITPGEAIVRDEDEDDWVHAHCAVNPPPPEPKACTRCWLVHPEGACDRE